MNSVFNLESRMAYDTVRLNIGEFFASRKPLLLYTLLGSCVAVCLHDRVAEIGGMNHILLPGKADYRKFDASSRYALNAVELLINKVMKLGGRRDRLTAKVFGGGHVLHSVPFRDHVGRRNIDFVLDILNTEKIRVISRDVGGQDSRKVYFHTRTGEAWVGRIQPVHSEQIRREEQTALSRTSQVVNGKNNITLFK